MEDTVVKKINKRRTRYWMRQPSVAFKEMSTATVDIETHGLGGDFIVGCIKFSDTDEIVYFSTIEEWTNIILRRKNRGLRWIAHNGVNYDYLYLQKCLENKKNDYPGMVIDYKMSGDRIIAITIRYQNCKTMLQDSVTLLPASLDKISGALVPEAPKQHREWKNTDGSENFFNPDDVEDMEYLRRDVETLHTAFHRYRRIVFDNFGINTGITAAGTAIKAATACLPEKHGYWRQRPNVENFVRGGYWGGWTFLTTIEKQYDLVHIDFNAMYPDKMRDAMPCGAACKVYAEYPQFFGFYDCDVDVPLDEKYPFIPSRNENGVVEIAVGYLEHVILPTFAIDYARECGYAVKINEGYVFPHAEKIFADFVEKCASIERGNKGNALGLSAKLMRNSAYGKLGEKQITTGIRWYADGIPSDKTPVLDPRNGDFSEHMAIVTEENEKPYMHIHMAAIITYKSRIQLNKVARFTQAVYGDTDSIFCSSSMLQPAIDAGLITIGVEYGQVKIEDYPAVFQAGGPKNYQYTDENNVVHDCAKGIPHKAVDSEEHKAALLGETVVVPYTSVIKMPTLLKHPDALFTSERVRSYSSIKNSRYRIEGDKILPPIRKRKESSS